MRRAGTSNATRRTTKRPPAFHGRIGPAVSTAAFPPTLEISDTTSDPDGDRPLEGFVCLSFLFDHATEEASPILDLRTTDHPVSTVAPAITIETAVRRTLIVGSLR